MKAAIMRGYGAPSVLEYGEVPTPKPGPGQVLVRVLAAGVNRLDHYIREGSLTQGLALPHILGSDAAGVVESLGTGASRFKVGDRVIPMPGYPLNPQDARFEPLSAAPSYAIRGIAEWGTYAEFLVVPEQWLVADATGLSPSEVATLPMALVAGVRAVKVVGNVAAGEFVLVHAGASGTGSTNIQIAKALGARVAATVRTQDKADFVRGLGAELVVSLSDDDFVPKVREWTSNKGVDAVIDNLGGEVLSRSLETLRPLGRLVSMGMVMGMEATIQIRPLFFGQHQIRGSMMGGVDDLEWGLQMVKEGKIKPALDKVYQLQEAAAAHEYIAAGRARGNVVLVP